MYKRILILILILAVVLSFAVLEQVAVGSTFDNLKFRLEQIDSSIQNNTTHIEDINNIIEYWEDRKHLLYMVIPHIEIRSIDIYLYQLKNAIEFEKNFEASEYIEILISQTQSVPKTFVLCLENIL